MFFFKDFIYLFMREQREIEAGTQAEGEAGSMQGAQRGTRSRDSRSTAWAQGGAKLLSPPGCPIIFKSSFLKHPYKQKTAFDN